MSRKSPSQLSTVDDPVDPVVPDERFNTIPDDTVNLCITSEPSFPFTSSPYTFSAESDYISEFLSRAKTIRQKLTQDGSFVVIMKGMSDGSEHTKSLYNFRILLRMLDELGFFLAQDFYWHNPSDHEDANSKSGQKRCRPKDEVHTVWWFSKTEWPKSNVKNVLAPYSDGMKKLLANPSKFYTPKLRPSGHDISGRFAKDNGGSIPPNFFEYKSEVTHAERHSVTKSLSAQVLATNLAPDLVRFFVRMLTEPGDLVVEPVYNRNAARQVALEEGRVWRGLEF